MYGVKPIRLREQVRRNIERFPGHYMFQLNRKETDVMVSQNAIPSRQHTGGYFPYVFTEHGVLMLANVLNSKEAIIVSMRLIEIFVKIRNMVFDEKKLLKRVEKLEKDVAQHGEDIQDIVNSVKQILLKLQNTRERIGFKWKPEN